MDRHWMALGRLCPLDDPQTVFYQVGFLSNAPRPGHQVTQRVMMHTSTKNARRSQRESVSLADDKPDSQALCPQFGNLPLSGKINRSATAFSLPVLEYPKNLTWLQPGETRASPQSTVFENWRK
jgi:hypothetical protein